MRIGLISCSKTKLDHAAPAEELYTGPIFKLAKPWIKKRVDDWGILSAKYGLVLPDQVIEPYDLKMSDLNAASKTLWRDTVRDQMMRKWGNSCVYTVLAGHEYKTHLEGGFIIEDPIACWTQWRIDKGMTGRRAAIGIGVLKKLLKEDTPYY